MKPQQIFLAVYGTLMTGESNHRLLENAVSIQECTITGTLYDTGCGYPAFAPEGDQAIKAELVEINIADWANVDRLEGYPHLYDRKIIEAVLPDGSTREAWVYIMNRLPRNAKIIINGDWKNHRRSRS